MTLSEQGSFNERVEKEAKRLYQCARYDFQDGKDREDMFVKEVRLVFRTLVLEEIIGENELSYSIPQGMPESVYNRFKGADELRAKQRKKLEDTHGTK